jgi:flagellar basal-body rod protein FlgB
MAVENKLTDFVFNKMGVPTLRKYLDLAAYRHKLVSGNIANVSTPGYRQKDIDFQKEFLKATGKTNHLEGTITNPGHIPLGTTQNSQPKVSQEKVQDGSMNSVDIDKEVSTMAQNELLYTIGAKMLQRKFEGIKTAITSK